MMRGPNRVLSQSYKSEAKSGRGHRDNTLCPCMWSTAPSGPQSRLDVIQQLASALEAAIGQIITLPLDDDDAAEARERAFTFVADANRTKVKTLSKYFAVEEAARVFQPLWEEFSSIAYLRGGYKFTSQGYECEPGTALHQIIRKLDSTVAESLVGTAIENIRR